MKYRSNCVHLLIRNVTNPPSIIPYEFAGETIQSKCEYGGSSFCNELCTTAIRFCSSGESCSAICLSHSSHRSLPKDSLCFLDMKTNSTSDIVGMTLRLNFGVSTYVVENGVSVCKRRVSHELKRRTLPALIKLDRFDYPTLVRCPLGT